MSRKRGFFVITYDIPDDKRRLRVARLLERYGERVQYSVFEMYLSSAEWRRLRIRLLRVLQLQEDQVRIYRLCPLCRAQIEVLGQGAPTSPPSVVQIV